MDANVSRQALANTRAAASSKIQISRGVLSMHDPELAKEKRKVAKSFFGVNHRMFDFRRMSISLAFRFQCSSSSSGCMVPATLSHTLPFAL